MKLAADYSVLAEDLKKLAGEEAPAESEKEEKVDSLCAEHEISTIVWQWV